jgi:hypothetical protein
LGVRSSTLQPLLLHVSLLQINQTIQTLAIQDLLHASTAAASCPVLQALAFNNTIRCLTVHKLQPGQIQQLAAALLGGGCGGNLQQLNLPGARWVVLPCPWAGQHKLSSWNGSCCCSTTHSHGTDYHAMARCHRCHNRATTSTY